MSIDRLLRIGEMKLRGHRVVAVKCADAKLAELASFAGADVLVIDDEAVSNLQGMPGDPDVNDIARHLDFVSRGNLNSLIIAEIPRAYCLKSSRVLETGEMLKARGAHMVLLKGIINIDEHVRQLTRSGIPVCISLERSNGIKTQAAEVVNASVIKRLESAGTALFIYSDLVAGPLHATVPVLSKIHYDIFDGSVVSVYDLIQRKAAEFADVRDNKLSADVFSSEILAMRIGKN